MLIKIEVSWLNISQGQKNSVRENPIALALLEAIPGCDPRVTAKVITINKKNYPLPLDIQYWLESWERGSNLSPTGFLLNYP